MPYMPNEPEAFAECVADMLRRLQPDYAIDIIGAKELLVNGRRLDLENVYRMVQHEPSRGTEITEHYLEQLFAGEAIQMESMTLDFAKTRIMPRIQPESIFERLERNQVAHIPHVNGTVIVFVTDLPHMTVSITTEQIQRWKIEIEAVEEIARKNLDNYAPELEIQIVESKEGGKAAILGQQDGFDAARMLLTDLYNKLAAPLGGKPFYVAIPARDMFVAFSQGPDPFLNRLRDRITSDYKRLPYPITPHWFLVTNDGISGTVGPDIDKNIDPAKIADEFEFG
jgi:uncharacterized protein YtpQ (UPF0354 family)